MGDKRVLYKKLGPLVAGFLAAVAIGDQLIASWHLGNGSRIFHGTMLVTVLIALISYALINLRIEKDD
jgi:hypothetical protein